ncbi:TetR/AcrR family transcriptional regulator [Paenibacillus cremeus]|nr:TetR/AcrR family transcriptional regulator [Paenibacillus cremeus]
MDSTTTSSPATDKAAKAIEKLILKIIPIMQRSGFSLLKMDEAAKTMDVSKATMYKYFASKDEIVEKVVDHFAEYISKMVQDMPQADQATYYKSLRKVFQQSLVMAVYLSDVFLHDLSSLYPQLYDRLMQLVEVRNARLAQFFAEGMESGVFHRLNPVVLILQIDTMLRKMIDPKLLTSQHLSMKQALADYYDIMKRQVLKQDFAADQDEEDSEMESFLNHMVQKLSRY